MNCLNKLSIAVGAGAGAGTRAGAETGTRARTRVGLRDRIRPGEGEVLLQGRFWRGEQRKRDPLGAISVDDLIDE